MLSRHGGNRLRQREQGQVLELHPGSSARLVGTGGAAVSPPQWGLLCAGLAGPRTSGGGWADHIPVPVHLLKTQDPKGNHTLSFQTWPGSPEPSGWGISQLYNQVSFFFSALHTFSYAFTYVSHSVTQETNTADGLGK